MQVLPLKFNLYNSNVLNTPKQNQISFASESSCEDDCFVQSESEDSDNDNDNDNIESILLEKNISDKHNTKNKNKLKKIIILSALLLLPIIKSNVQNESELDEPKMEEKSEAKKSNNIIEFVVDKVIDKKVEEKKEENKNVESKFIGLLEPVINKVGEKLLRNSKVRNKIKNELLSDKAVIKAEEFFESEVAANKIKTVLQDEEIQDALLQALGNKATDKNVKFLMQNRKMQDAIITALKDPKILQLLAKPSETGNVPKSVREAVIDVIESESIIRLAMNNKYFQEMVAEFLKNPDEGFNFKESKELREAKSGVDRMIVKYNKLINVDKDDNMLTTTCESLKTFGTVGAIGGEAAGNVAGYYLPYIGKPIFGNIGLVAGGILGGIYAPIRNTANEIFKLFGND